MNKNDLEVTIQILDLVLKYGAPFVLKMISTWESDTTITPSMVIELKASIKDSNELFK